MSLTISTPGIFTEENTLLQNNHIKIVFPLAEDKNIEGENPKALYYEYRYTYRPIYCGEIIEGAYIYSNKDPQTDIVSPWSYFEHSIVDNDSSKGEVTLLTPNFNSDIEIIYEIRAVDDFNQEYSVNVLKTNSIYLITNKVSELKIISLTWDPNENIDVLGKISHSGFSTPANFYEENFYSTFANEWNLWRVDLKNIFGEIKFSYFYKYGDSNDNLSNLIDSEAYFTILNPDWTTINFKIDNSNKIFNKEQAYYFQFFLQKSGLKNNINSIINNDIDPYTKIILLLQDSPVYQIRKGRIKVNMPKDEAIFTGGGIFSHGPFNKSFIDNDTDKGRSIALYDHHISPDTSQSSNRPSIGFFDTEHNELGYLQADENKLKINFDTDIIGDIYENGEKLSNKYVLQSKILDGGKPWSFVD